ncbi:hypothetical protein O6W96_18795 [Sphingomonas faeni]
MRKISLSFESALTHRITMPIRPENRWLYPIDWPQLSDTIRFGRAGARCEQCARPHRRFVAHLGDGRWWDAETGCWRSAQGRRIAVRDRFELAGVHTTYVVLACAHLDHDPGHNMPANLAALCQRCHMLHDAAEHRWQRWWNAFRLRALRDLYEDPRVTRDRLALSPRSISGRTHQSSAVTR